MRGQLFNILHLTGSWIFFICLPLAAISHTDKAHILCGYFIAMTLRNAASEEMQENSPLLSRGDTTIHLQWLLVPVLTACTDSLKQDSIHALQYLNGQINIIIYT